MQEEINLIKNELSAIKERNNRVEADKAWETSYFRIITLTIVTFLIASLFLYLIDVKYYILNALVPAAGFFISTLSIPILKKLWINHFLKKN